MSEETERINLDPDGDGFVLRRGSKLLANLTADDVLALAQAAPSFRQAIMSRLHQNAVFATPVARSQADWDALDERVLIQFEFLPSGMAVYELTPENCKIFSDRLRKLLAERPDAQLTRQ
jgi:hypothetical protein